MKLDREFSKDKILACFMGKNIGGTMGTPYNGKRGMQDIPSFIEIKSHFWLESGAIF